MNLFIDTSNWQLIFILEKNGQVIDHFQCQGLTKISDVAIEELKKFLSRNKLTIKDIENFYVTKGPGSYTGVRVGLGIVKTLFTLNNSYNCFVIDSLQFQASGKKCISILDARGNKFYVGILEENEYIVNPAVVTNDELQILIKNNPKYEIVKDYEGIDVVNNFMTIKQKFQKITCPEDFNPLYIKGFI